MSEPNSLENAQSELADEWLQKSNPMTPEKLLEKYPEAEIDLPSPLVGLEKIDWASLHHAHGSADDVPTLLRILTSDVENDRKFAIELLFETIWHQGTVYEATPVAVPFLYQLLSSPSIPDRASIAHLLACIADGSSYYEVHAYLDAESEAACRRILTRRGKVLETVIEEEKDWVRESRKAVEEQLPLLYPFLKSEFADVREQIATALSLYPSQRRKSIPVLESALIGETNQYTAKSIMNSIAKLQAYDELG